MEKKKEKEQKKLEREQRRLQEIEQTKKEIEELLNNINEMTGNSEGIKMVDLKMPTKKERILSCLLKYGLSFVLLLSITGFLNWVYYDSIWTILGLALSIVILEYILNFIMMFFFGKYIIYSFGTINILPPILAIVACSLIFPFIELINAWLLIVVILIYIITRKVMISLLKGDNKKIIIRGK